MFPKSERYSIKMMNIVHQNIVIFLPGVMPEVVEVALLEFYIKSDPTKLRSVLNVSSVTLHGNVIDASKDTDKLHTQLNVSSVTTTKYNGTETSEDTEKVYTLMDESNNSSYIDKAENNIQPCKTHKLQSDF